MLGQVRKRCGRRSGKDRPPRSLPVEPGSYDTHDLTRGDRWKGEDFAGWWACYTPPAGAEPGGGRRPASPRGALDAGPDPPRDAGRAHGGVQEPVGERVAHRGPVGRGPAAAW